LVINQLVISVARKHNTSASIFYVYAPGPNSFIPRLLQQTGTDAIPGAFPHGSTSPTRSTGTGRLASVVLVTTELQPVESTGHNESRSIRFQPEQQSKK
jgi:hypothetical protein